jgi:hypothetical protein
MSSVQDISFKVSDADRLTIKGIVARGWALGRLRKSYPDKLSMQLDITACHANGNALRLVDLLAADDFNFAHDMSGICRCLDRDMGRLTKGFSPRFSQRA